MAQVREPAPCPECGSIGKRLLSAPNLASGSPILRRAAAINERSQHEPRIVKRETPHGKLHKPRKLHHSHSGYPWALGH